MDLAVYVLSSVVALQAVVIGLLAARALRHADRMADRVVATHPGAADSLSVIRSAESAPAAQAPQRAPVPEEPLWSPQFSSDFVPPGR